MDPIQSGVADLRSEWIRAVGRAVHAGGRRVAMHLAMLLPTPS